MCRALLLAVALALVPAPAVARQVLTQDLDANGFQIYGPSAPLLPTSVLRLQDMAVGSCLLKATGVNVPTFVCAVAGTDYQQPMTAADASIVFPSVSSIRLRDVTGLSVMGRSGSISGAAQDITASVPSTFLGLNAAGTAVGFQSVPGTSVTGTPNTIAWFNGSGLLNSLALSAEFGPIAGGTLSLAANGVANAKLAQMPARSFKVNATNATGTPADLACTGAGQVPQDTGTALVCQQLAYSSLSGSVPAVTSGAGDVNFTGPGAAATTIQANVVTNAKSAQMAATTIKANATNATANAQDLACSTAGTFLGNLTGTSLACNVVPGASVRADGIATGTVQLASIAAASLADGTVAYVDSVGDQFALEQSALTSDGITIVAASGKAGFNWVRLKIPNPLWLAQTTWYMDPSAGGDENTGAAGHPLKTSGELQRRLNGIFQTTTVNLLSSLPDTDPLAFYPSAKATSISIIGTETVVASGVVASSVTPGWYGSNVLGQITITGFNWAPFVGSLIRLSGSSGGTGTYSEVIANLGSGTAALGPLTINSATSPTIFSAGQTVEVISLPRVTGAYSNGANLFLRLVTIRNDTTTVSMRQDGHGASISIAQSKIESTTGFGLSITARSVSISQTSIVTGGGVGLFITGNVVNLSSGAAVGALVSTTSASGAAVALNDMIFYGGGRLQATDNTAVTVKASTSPALGVGVYNLSAGQFGLWLGSNSILNLGTIAGSGNSGSSFIAAIDRSSRINQTAATASPPISDVSSAGVKIGWLSNPTLSNGDALSSAFTGSLLERAQNGYGPAVASVANLAPVGMRYYTRWVVTGTTPIQTLSTDAEANAVPRINNGLQIELALQGTLTLKHNVAPSSGFGSMLLVTGADETLPAGTRVILEFNGSAWNEISHTVPGGPLGDPGGNGIVVRTGPGTSTAGQLSGPVSTTGTSLVTALNLSATGITGSLPLGNQAGPTGTGFEHVTGGARDPAARAVDLSNADATGTLAAARAPAYTGPVTTSAGSLVTALNLSASGISGSLALSFLAQGGATTNQALTWNGSAWVPSTLSTTPSGAAGGALTGSYPNPSIANSVIVPANFSAFAADTVFCNDQGVSATPRLCTLGTGLSFDPVGHQIFSTVAGGSPAASTYWVSSAASAPANAVQMQLLGAGLLQQSVSGGISTPSALSVPANAIVEGTTAGGQVTADNNFTINSSTHTMTATGPVSLQGATTTIGAWNGIGKFTGGVVGVASPGSDYELPLIFNTGATRSGNTVTNDLITGHSGGQIIVGGLANGEQLTLTSTLNASKGHINLGGVGASIALLDEPTGRTAWGQTLLDAHMHVVVPDDTAGTGATTAWDNRFFVVGESGATAPGFGVSVGSSQIHLDALSPNIAWLGMRMNASNFVWYSNAATPGLFQDGSGNVGVATLSAGGLVYADTGGQLHVGGPATVPSDVMHFYATDFNGLSTTSWLVPGMAAPMPEPGATPPETRLTFAPVRVRLLVHNVSGVAAGCTTTFAISLNGNPITSTDVTVSPSTPANTFQDSGGFSTPGTSLTDSWGVILDAQPASATGCNTHVYVSAYFYAQ